MPTDKERIDFIQELTEGYGGGWVLRRSLTGRGWRLHETSAIAAVPDVRDAIDRTIEFHKMLAEEERLDTESEDTND